MNKKFLWKKGSSIIFVSILLAAGVFPFISSSIAINEAQIENLSNPLENDWWPMFRHDSAHSGFSSETAPEDDQLLWSSQTNYFIQSSPAVSHGRVYVCSWDWNIYCFDMDNGNLLWNYSTDSQITSSPAVVNGRVYFGSEDYKLYCLDAISGAFLWAYKTKFIIDSSPTIVDNAVFFGSSDGGLYCVNADDGSLLWSYQTGSVILSSPAVADGKVYFGITLGDILCLNSMTGDIIWTYTMTDGTYSSPTIDNGKIYFGSNDKNVYCLNAVDGGLIWNYSALSEVHSSPVIAYDAVYIGASDGRLLCLDKDTGDYLWSYQISGSVESQPSVADGKVYFGTNPCCGFLSYFICLDAFTGAKIWDYNFGTQIGMKSSPAIAAHKVFVCSGDGKVYAFGDIAYLADANGPYYGLLNNSIDFTGSVYGGEPDFTWYWEFGDGGESTEQNPTHIYSQVGQYDVTLTVTDNNDSVAIDETSVFIKMPNRPPSIPEISGPASGKKGVAYPYTFVSTDPDGDDVYYVVSWGCCGNETHTYGPYPSGEEAIVSHTWNEKGTFTIRVKAKDTKGAESDWATFEVTMPRLKISTSTLFLKLLERFPNAFPILRYLIVKY